MWSFSPKSVDFKRNCGSTNAIVEGTFLLQQKVVDPQFLLKSTDLGEKLHIYARSRTKTHFADHDFRVRFGRTV